MVTWLKFEKSTNYFDPATMDYHHLHVVEDLGTMFSSPSQEHLVSVKNVDEDQTNFVDVRFNARCCDFREMFLHRATTMVEGRASCDEPPTRRKNVLRRCDDQFVDNASSYINSLDHLNSLHLSSDVGQCASKAMDLQRLRLLQ